MQTGKKSIIEARILRSNSYT